MAIKFGITTFLIKTNKFDLGALTARIQYLTLGVIVSKPKIKGPRVTGPLLVFFHACVQHKLYMVLH